MYKLRHLEYEFWRMHLPDPIRVDDDDIIIMENLEVLIGVNNFNVSEDVVKRIPNIKTLSVKYDGQLIDIVQYLSCRRCLSKLESLSLIVYSTDIGMLQINFPPSLIKLIIQLPRRFEWEEHILPSIGSLPLLEELRLRRDRFRTREWETVEDQFQSLKSLILFECDDLEKLTMSESSHFPRLIKLHLFCLNELKEIPSEIGDIPTLRSIVLTYCKELVVLLAKEILEKQEDLHGDQLDLLVHATVRKEDEALEKLATSNFKVTEMR
ncbi:uncharacterized protein LOC125218713 isoform X1 [Salvia hispanica]|uniref:uncharacterized protein LOC125218713 isoform X1 n=1 Tax=Salvia hispanica TaxID=49212 RepID=UPI0020096248|nr:uncharacterized protein LOC125218713 isoform X1 [Salvia hispanica]